MQHLKQCIYENDLWNFSFAKLPQALCNICFWSPYKVLSAFINFRRLLPGGEFLLTVSIPLRAYFLVAFVPLIKYDDSKSHCSSSAGCRLNKPRTSLWGTCFLPLCVLKVNGHVKELSPVSLRSHADAKKHQAVSSEIEPSGSFAVR